MLNIKLNTLFIAGLVAMFIVVGTAPVRGESGLTRHKVEAILANIEYQTWVRRIVEHVFEEGKMKALDLEYMGHPKFGWKTGKDFQDYFLRRVSEIVKQGENYDYYIDPCDDAIYKAIDEVLHDRHLSYLEYDHTFETASKEAANRLLEIIKAYPDDLFSEKRWLNFGDYDLALLKRASRSVDVMRKEVGNPHVNLETRGKLSKDHYILFEEPWICKRG